MSKKSIGQFITTLRKAGGMTQQDIADYLHVSNKSVSRWERDECSPDISLIPVLADLFGVSCDELLRGERMTEEESKEREKQKTEKRAESLLHKRLSTFKLSIGSALAVAVIGIFSMFGISYGFSHPIAGFCVMLSFEILSLWLTVLATSRTKALKSSGELLQVGPGERCGRFWYLLSRLSFWGIYTVFGSVVLSAPYLLLPGQNGDAMPFRTYIGAFGGPILAVLLFAYFIGKKPYIAWITDDILLQEEKTHLDIKKMRMNMVQIGTAILAGIIVIFRPYLLSSENRYASDPHPAITWEFKMAGGVVWALLAIGILYFVFEMVTSKERKGLVLIGMRNVCLSFAAWLISGVHTIGWARSSYYARFLHSDYEVFESAPLIRSDGWNPEHLLYVLVYCLSVFFFFFLIDTLLRTQKISAEEKHEIPVTTSL